MGPKTQNMLTWMHKFVYLERNYCYEKSKMLLTFSPSTVTKARKQHHLDIIGNFEKRHTLAELATDGLFPICPKSCQMQTKSILNFLFKMAEKLYSRLTSYPVIYFSSKVLFSTNAMRKDFWSISYSFFFRSKPRNLLRNEPHLLKRFAIHYRKPI